MFPLIPAKAAMNLIVNLLKPDWGFWLVSPPSSSSHRCLLPLEEDDDDDYEERRRRKKKKEKEEKRVWQDGYALLCIVSQ